MAKRNRVKDNEKLLKEGRESGIGKEYLPWIRSRDVPSLGRSTRLRGIVTEEEIDNVFAKNISFFHGHYNINELDSFLEFYETGFDDLVLEYIKRIVEMDISFLFDNDMNVEKGMEIASFKHLLAKKIIFINFLEPININKKLELNVFENLMHKEFNISS